MPFTPLPMAIRGPQAYLQHGLNMSAVGGKLAVAVTCLSGPELAESVEKVG